MRHVDCHFDYRTSTTYPQDWNGPSSSSIRFPGPGQHEPIGPSQVGGPQGWQIERIPKAPASLDPRRLHRSPDLKLHHRNATFLRQHDIFLLAIRIYDSFTPSRYATPCAKYGSTGSTALEQQPYGGHCCIL